MEEESLCFYDQNFLAQASLTQENIIQYFSYSPFYEKGSLNEILKMQSQFANIDVSHKLTTLVGFYYILEHHGNDLFIIAKKSNTGEKTTILKVYYCIYGYIYCAPTAKAVSDSRVIDSLIYLNEALDRYEKMKSFNWIEGLKFGTGKDKTEEQTEDTKLLFQVLHEFESKSR